ncbi:MAG: glycosyl transferase [Ruminococcus sp.]|nr:glycosyl transferase [Ruminococcus sp.]
MSLKNTLRKFGKKIQKSDAGKWFFHRVRINMGKKSEKKVTDFEYITTEYKRRTGEEINLKDPQRYSEKLQWLKLFYRNDAMPICSDKLKVREYMEERGYGHLLNNLIAVYDDGMDINTSELPDRFAMKTNHGSSWNLICTDKSKVNWFWWKRIFNCWLRRNLYTFGREWNYKHIEPKIIVEEFLDHTPLVDYKFMCFNGEPKYMQINHDIDGKHYVDFLNIDWEKQGFTYRNYTMSDILVPKPEQFEEMKKIARDLAQDFPYVRVDFYNFEGRIIFGELTFFPGGGFQYPIPIEYDYILGKELKLPEANFNLDILNSLK